MRIYRHNLGPLDNNTYLLVEPDSNDAAIVDPTFDSRPLLEETRRAGWQIRYVLNTHAHIDHVVENAYFARETDAILALHPDDQPLLDAMQMQAAWLGVPAPEVIVPRLALAHGAAIQIGAMALRVARTPGHSPGHVVFLGDGFVVAGDVLFRGSIGRTDLPGGSYEQLMASIARELLPLPDETVVYTGHGETTTIGEERRGNPFLAGMG